MIECINCHCMIDDNSETCLFCNSPQIKDENVNNQPTLRRIIKAPKSQQNLSRINYEFKNTATMSDFSKSISSTQSNDEYFNSMLDIAMMDEEDYNDFRTNYVPKYQMETKITSQKKDQYDINYDGYYDNIEPVMADKTLSTSSFNKSNILQMILFFIASGIFMVGVMYIVLFTDLLGTKLF